MLECGVALKRLEVAYRTYGTLNADKTNAILICHALTADQYVAETHPLTGRPGWWEMVVGSGKAIDTTDISSSAPMCWADVWAQPDPARRVAMTQRSCGALIFHRSPSATWCVRKSG